MLRNAAQLRPTPGEEAHLFGDGVTPFRILAVTTTGCFAVRVAGSDRVRVFHWYYRGKGKEPVTIEPARALVVWSCLAPWNPAPAGRLTRLHCNSCGLTALDVRSLPGLVHLRCEHNRLERLDCSGLAALATLDCTGNELAELDVADCRRLRRLRVGGNPHLPHPASTYLAAARGGPVLFVRTAPTATSLFDL